MAEEFIPLVEEAEIEEIVEVAPDEEVEVMPTEEIIEEVIEADIGEYDIGEEYEEEFEEFEGETEEEVGRIYWRPRMRKFYRPYRRRWRPRIRRIWRPRRWVYRRPRYVWRARKIRYARPPIRRFAAFKAAKGRTYLIPKGGIKEGKVMIAGAEEKAAALSETEAKLLAKDIEGLVAAFTDKDVAGKTIRDIIMSAKSTIIAFVRVMKDKTGQPYVGTGSVESGLAIWWLTPRDLEYTTWTLSATAGWNNWYGDPSDRTKPFKTNKQSGVLGLAVQETTPVQVIDALDINKAGKDLPEWTLERGDANISKLTWEVVQFPEKSMLIKLHAKRTASVFFRPLFLKCTLTDNLRGYPTTSPIKYS